MEDNLIFVDTETTGLEDGMLVQLATAVGLDIVIEEKFKPPVPIEYEAMAVHHITERDVAGREMFTSSARARALQDTLDCHVMVAHNAQFDIAVLRREWVEVRRFIDTLKVARRLWPRMKSHKLQVLRYALGIDVDAKAHDAAGDVEVLRAVFNRMVDDGFAKGMYPYGGCVAAMEQWSQMPVTLYRMPFGKHSGKTFEEIERGDRDYLHWIVAKSDITDEDVLHTVKLWLTDPEAARKETEV